MFFDPQRIHHMREMILASNVETRKAALAKLLPYQREDFLGIFKEMKGLPVTIRLLDPPLHEFLPHNEKDQQELAQSLNLTLDQVKARVDQLHEANPMLGHRGDRLAVTYPEILEMQVQAIIEAACQSKKAGIKVLPEIMIPLAGTKKELEYLKKFTEETAARVIKEQGVKLDYMYGTMIEVPRAALVADAIAEVATFFSFGTNDLTQMTFGFSRDDVNSFLPDYLKKEIPRSRSVPDFGHGRRGATDRNGRPQGPQRPSGPQMRHLRRTRRRSQEHSLLPQGGIELRELLAVSRSDRPFGRGTRGDPQCDQGRKERKEIEFRQIL